MRSPFFDSLKKGRAQLYVFQEILLSILFGTQVYLCIDFEHKNRMLLSKFVRKELPVYFLGIIQIGFGYVPLKSLLENLEQTGKLIIDIKFCHQFGIWAFWDFQWSQFQSWHLHFSVPMYLFIYFFVLLIYGVVFSFRDI